VVGLGGEGGNGFGSEFGKFVELDKLEATELGSSGERVKYSEPFYGIRLVCRF
jgi:hypothetical protein